MPAVKLAFQSSLDEAIAGLQGKAALAGNSPEGAAPTGRDQSGAGSASNAAPHHTPMSNQQLRQLNSYQYLLTCYGVQSELIKTDFVAHCPFNGCPELYGDKEPKFQMNTQTAQYRCFRCGAKGNNYTFIRDIHSLWFPKTTDEQYESLKKLRKGTIDIHIMKEMQLAYNGTTNEWMLPLWSADGQAKGIVNLYVWRESFDESTGTMRRAILSGPSFKHHPYGIHRLRSGSQRPLWILEGQWDYLAFNTLLHRTGQAPHIDTLGAPGAGTFPTSALQCLNGRKIIIAYDNDEAGRNGTRDLLVKMQRASIVTTALHVLAWPTDMDKCKDISDCMVSLPAKYIKKMKS